MTPVSSGNSLQEGTGLYDVECATNDNASSDDSAEKGKHFETKGKPPRVKVPPGVIPSLALKRKTKPSAQSTACDEDHVFFGVRCQLTRLVHVMKQRMASRGCSCCTCGYGSGYTLDQAVALEEEIYNWVTNLPESLKYDSSHQKHFKDTKSAKRASLAAELSIFTNRMVIAVYLPLMRSNSSAGGLSEERSSATFPWSPPSRTVVDAAKSVISTARMLHQHLCTSHNGPSLLLGDYYPLDKAILDATVICANALFDDKLSRNQGSEKASSEELVTAGLEALSVMGANGIEFESITGIIQRKLDDERLANSSRGKVKECRGDKLLKRKHLDIESEGEVEFASETMSQGSSRLENVRGKQDNNGEIPPISVPPSIQKDHPILLSHPPPEIIVPIEKSKEKKKPISGYRDRGENGPEWMRKLKPIVSTFSGPRVSGMEDSGVPSSSHEGALVPSGDLSPICPIKSVQNATEYHNLQRDGLSRSDFGPTSSGHSWQPFEYGSTYSRSQNDVHLYPYQRRRLSKNISPEDLYATSQPFNVQAHDSLQGSSPTKSFDVHRGFENFQVSFGPSVPTSSTPYSSTSSPLAQSDQPTHSPSDTGPGASHSADYDPGPSLISRSITPPPFGSRTPALRPSTSEYNSMRQPMVVNSGLSLPISTDCQRSFDTLTTVATSPIYEKSQHSLYDARHRAGSDRGTPCQMQYGVSNEQIVLAASQVPYLQLQNPTDNRFWHSTDYFQQ